MLSPSVLAALALPLAARAQTYSATYLPSNAPPTTEQGQTGTNQCGSGSNQTSVCQNVYINAVDDFCIFAPPEPGPQSVIGNTERIEVAWCVKPGYGTRLIPDGAISGAHFVQTPDYVQVTGVGNLTLVNIPSGDEGGELDPHGADGNGNPIGGLVFSSAFGQLEQLHEWTNFVSDTEFCIRGCKPGPMAPAWCQHIYDTLGCAWNMPANYDAGVFENCKGDDVVQPMGVYGTSTFFQGQPVTPDAHPVPSSSLCTTLSTIGNLALSTSTSASASSTAAVSPSSSAASRPASASSGSLPSSASSPTAPVSSSGSSSTASRTGSSSSSSGTGSPTGAANNAAPHSVHFAWQLAFAALGVVAGAMFVL